MARYRRIDPYIWHDDKFPIFSDDAKLLFFHLLTTPRGNPLGCFVQGKTDMAEYLQWSMKRFAIPFRELLSSGRVQYDDKTRLVLLPNYLKYNPLENENQAKMALKYLTELPYNEQCFQYLKLFLEQYNKPFLEPLLNGISNRLDTQNGIVNGTPNTEPYSLALTVNRNTEPNTPLPPKGAIVVFPDWLPSELWDNYLDMRKTIKRPLTSSGQRLAIQKLTKLKESGCDPTAVLEQSILHSWQGLFAPKEERNGSRSDHPQRPSHHQAAPGKYAHLGTVIDPGGED